MSDLSITICNVEMKLQQLGWIEVQQIGDRRQVLLKEGRMMMWAITAADAGGIPKEKTLSLLGSCPSDKQWWMVRQLLPEEALQALDRKLSAMLQQQENLAA